MVFQNQQVLPAFREMKQLEQFIESDYEYGLLLESHLGQLRGIMNAANKAEKKLILHADLINGLKADEYAVEYICQELKPAGIISTKSNVILKAKQKGVYAIQRVFLLDSTSLEKTYKLVSKIKPDFIEILPGVIPSLIQEIHEKTRTPILAGGLIRSEQDVVQALDAGAMAVTTSRQNLWKSYYR